MGGLLLASGLGKVFTHADLLGTIAAYRILPRSAPYAVFDGAAWALAFAEIFCGIGLASGFPPAAWASAVLFLIFAFAVAVNTLRGRREIECGCAIGAGGARISWGVCLRAALLAVLAAGIGATGSADGGSSLFVPRIVGVLFWVLCLAAMSLSGDGFAGESAR